MMIATAHETGDVHRIDNSCRRCLAAGLKWYLERTRCQVRRRQSLWNFLLEHGHRRERVLAQNAWYASSSAHGAKTSVRNDAPSSGSQGERTRECYEC